MHKKLLIKKIIKTISTLIGECVVIVAVALIAINIIFAYTQSPPFYSGEYKIWAHRGYWKQNLPNSIESYTKAFSLGARGIELDIHYNTDSKEYIVSHDYPYNPTNGRLLTLEAVLKRVGPMGCFWLDFKNLETLSKENARIAISTLYALLSAYRLTDKVILESKNPVNLAIASKAGLYTSYWIEPEAEDFFQFWLYIYLCKIFHIYGNFSAISMDYTYYSNKIEKIFAHVPIHLFTVNDMTLVNRLMDKPEVKIILSDESFYLMKGKNASAKQP